MSKKESAVELAERLAFEAAQKKAGIEAAQKRIQPITRSAAKGVDDNRFGHFGVIDNFIAVVDGRHNLPAAFRQARDLIQLPPFQFVGVIRESESVAGSYNKARNLFTREVFGSEPRILDERTVRTQKRRGEFRGRTSTGPAGMGSILIWPEKNKFGFLRGSFYGSDDKFQCRYQSFLTAPFYRVGSDFAQIFRAAHSGFPEYLSWHARIGQRFTPPGYMHFDSGYKVKDSQSYSEEERRSYQDLPHAFLKSVLQRPAFDALPGDVATTASLFGGGTIAAKYDSDFYQEYCEKRKSVVEPGIQFMDNPDLRGYQSQDGDGLVTRLEDWPDHESGAPRLPGLHGASLYDRHARITAIAASEVSFMAPSVYKHLGTVPPDIPEELGYFHGV